MTTMGRTAMNLTTHAQDGHDHHGHGHNHEHSAEFREASGRSLIIARVLIGGFRESEAEHGRLPH